MPSISTIVQRSLFWFLISLFAFVRLLRSMICKKDMGRKNGEMDLSSRVNSRWADAVIVFSPSLSHVAEREQTQRRPCMLCGWQAGAKHGRGQFIWSTLCRYEGEFEPLSVEKISKTRSKECAEGN